MIYDLNEECRRRDTKKNGNAKKKKIVVFQTIKRRIAILYSWIVMRRIQH